MGSCCKSAFEFKGANVIMEIVEVQSTDDLPRLVNGELLSLRSRFFFIALQ